MAASNDSQGLKIAVAVFVTLSVIMAVSLYFSYKAYTEADAKLTKANADLGTSKRALDTEHTFNEDLIKAIGVKADESDPAKTEMKNEYKKIDEKLKVMSDQVNAAVTQAQTNGASGQELEDSKAKVQSLANSFRSEPNKSYISALDRLTELLQNQALLTTRLSINYADAKRSLEGANGVNAQKLGVVEKALADRVADLEAEHKKHVEEREILITKVDQFTTENSKIQAELQGAQSKIRQLEDDYGKKLSIAQQTIREYRDRAERSDVVLDRPDGVVTFVDYTRGEIHCNVRKSTGARPQMVFSIFDRSSAGLPTDKPKGTVALVSVGTADSVARIIKTHNNIDPIHVGDFVYSAAWSPNEPIRFALVGKIDVNRDGRDDRSDLKRMIEASGGIVDYDLPPPQAGKETGKLTGRDAWYIVDERPPIRGEGFAQGGVPVADSEAFDKKVAEVVKEARLNGVRPMPIERLLPYLGYDFSAPVQGRVQRIDSKTMQRMQNPKSDVNKPKPVDSDAAAAEAAPKEEKAAEDMPKEDKPKEDAPPK